MIQVNIVQIDNRTW